MNDYFLSDVHLRDDRPERARRLIRFLDRVEPGDRLTIVGDLCDFWLASRRSPDQLARDEALTRLTAFRRSGGELSILTGNHDHWLTPFYADRLGATLLTEPVEVESHGVRLHLVHGHLLGARRRWKAVMESQTFFKGFGAIPSPVAKVLDGILDAKNQRSLEADEARHLAIYRDYAAELDGIDVAVFGHVHRAVDLPGLPRLIVLGGWQHRLSFLKINAAGAILHIEGDDPDGPRTTTEADANRNETSPVTT